MTAPFKESLYLSWQTIATRLEEITMALPSHLYRTYMWYKSEEQSLLAWIEETVAACDPHNNKTNTTNNQAPYASTGSFITAKSPKSRASVVLAKRNQSVSTAKVSAAPLKIYDILPAVELIATSEEVGIVPLHVAQSLRRVADLRTRCLSWFESNTAADDVETQESNKRHEHVVKVLREAMELLKHKGSITLPSTTSNTMHGVTTGNSQAQNISHVLSSLEISKTNTVLSNTLPDNRLESAVDRRPDPELSYVEIAQEEYNFARFCFWQDVEAIEDHIVLAITKLSLFPEHDRVLALLMNTAVDIVEKMDEDMRDTFEDYGKHELAFMKTGGFTKPAKLFAVPQLHLRVEVWDQINREEAIAFDPSEVSGASPFASRAEDQAAYDVMFVQRIITQAREHTNEVYDGLLLDPSTSRLRQLIVYHHKSQRLSFLDVRPPTSFAIRLDMLMDYILCAGMLQMPDRLQDAICNTIEATSQRVNYWHGTCYALSRAPELRDQILNASERVVERNTAILSRYDNTRNLLSTHPHLCLLNMSHLAYEHSVIASRAVEVGNIAATMAHVYNVLREEGLLSSEWADIEFLLIHGGIEALFQGVRPTTRERGRFAARLLHACGIREADFNTHFDGIKHGFFERRKLGITLIQRPLNELLFNRAMQTFERTKNYELGSTDAELIVSATVVPDLLNLPRKQTHLEGVHIKNRAALWKFKDKGPELPPIELLAVIRRGRRREPDIPVRSLRI